jgi:hypothetical protein
MDTVVGSLIVSALAIIALGFTLLGCITDAHQRLAPAASRYSPLRINSLRTLRLIRETQGGDAMPLVLRLFDAAGNQIKGDSKVPGYEGCIDLLEWSWVANFNPENLLNVTLKKSYDSATVPLLKKANSGPVLKASLFDIDTSDPTRVQRVDLFQVSVQQAEVAGTPEPPSKEGFILRCPFMIFYSPDQHELS